MLNPKVVHANPAAQMHDLRHDTHVPFNIFKGPCGFVILSVALEKLFAVAYRCLVVADDLRQRVLVGTSQIAALRAILNQ